MLPLSHIFNYFSSTHSHILNFHTFLFLCFSTFSNLLSFLCHILVSWISTFLNILDFQSIVSFSFLSGRCFSYLTWSLSVCLSSPAMYISLSLSENVPFRGVYSTIGTHSYFIYFHTSLRQFCVKLVIVKKSRFVSYCLKWKFLIFDLRKKSPFLYFPPSSPPHVVDKGVTTLPDLLESADLLPPLNFSTFFLSSLFVFWQNTKR